MKPTYEAVTDEFGTVIKCTTADGLISWIPTDPTNSDYQRYLESLKK